MGRLTPSQVASIDLNNAVLEHRRVKDVVAALGRPPDLVEALYAAAARAFQRLWRFRDLYSEAPLPADFRFAVEASPDRLASFIHLRRSAALLETLLGVEYRDDPNAADRLPAVCFPLTGVRGGMVLFADDGSLPAFPIWHTSWPATVHGTRITAIRLAKWSRWVNWAATLPSAVQHAAVPPAGLSARDRLLFDSLASALGPAPDPARHRFVRRIDGRRWVTATNAELAGLTGLTERQVRTASASLASAGVAERRPGRGDGQAWSIRLIDPE